VIGGDFNSVPTSAVYTLMSTGMLLHTHHGLMSDGIPVTFQDLHHTLFLHSAHCETFGREPEFTNFTDTWRGTVDYLWYSKNSVMVPVGVHKLIGVEEASSAVALPNKDFPSDHLCLVCKFGVKK